MWVSEDLYSRILQVMPIPCVDLIVVDETSNVLIVLRRHEPAAGQWWFPGERVLFGELRPEAARRKLEEECGLSSMQFEEVGTFDLLFDIRPGERLHSITTLFSAKVARDRSLRLDNQSHEACWLPSREWLGRGLHPFVRQRLEGMPLP